MLAGFAQKDQALFKVEVKTLSDDDKARKRWVTQQIGSRMKDIRKGLLSRAIAAGEIEPEQRESQDRGRENHRCNQDSREHGAQR